jgi:phosphoglycolate phosphatase
MLTDSTPFRAVLFDLDGTLADTLADLANAVNHALTTLGLPTHPLSAYRYFVGDGARNLIHRALPADRQDLLEPALALMRTHYDGHCFDETKLYPGIPELVTELHRRDLKLAVVSNKPDEFTKRMIAHYFGNLCSREPARGAVPSSAASRLAATASPFAAVRGHLAGTPLKPDPTAPLQVAATLGIPPAQWLYLGDTNTDMQTAVNAGMYPVGVLWGFRERAELEAAGAQRIIAQPADLLNSFPLPAR